jgi:hypothetical protein
MKPVNEFCDLGAHHSEDVRASPSSEGVHGSARNHDERSRLNVVA